MRLIAFDMTRMKPACVLVAAAMGGDVSIARQFDTRHWLLAPTPDLFLYPVSDQQIEQLVTMVDRKHPLAQESPQ